MAQHEGYTLVPHWIRGIPGRYFNIAASRSGVTHVTSSLAGSRVTASERYGITVKLFGRLFAVYTEGDRRLVSALELALAVDGGASGDAHGMTEPSKPSRSTSTRIHTEVQYGGVQPNKGESR